jgi:hypothetical protein
MPRRISSGNLGGRLIESDVTGLHFIAVRRNEIAHLLAAPSEWKTAANAEKPPKNEDGKHSCGSQIATFVKLDDRLPAQHLILHLRRGEAPGRWKSWAGCRTGISLVNEILNRCLTVLAGR